LHELLGAKRNKHADHDNADLAYELAPAMKRLGKVEMHSVGPRATPGEASRRIYVRNGWKEEVSPPGYLFAF
jgi:hypothetical protein